MCVNVSAREVQQPGFVSGVEAAVAAAGVDRTRLVLEITETALLKATTVTMSNLAGLRALGIRTSIDDFGTGFCSLSHLRQFPVDALKIAGEFVADSAPGSRSPAVAAAIVALSRSLAIATVAEGIETPEQAERMRDLGCTYGQGYYFARPMPARELRATFQRSSKAAATAGEGGADRRAGRVADALPQTA
jgi:EAL domain-containing protein (putative c-di-GMP-specific phosphodiesterase class I)